MPIPGAGDRVTVGTTVVLPAYNEQECLAEAVERTAAYLTECFDVWEIVVVDDGSKDNTGAIADGLASRHPRVRVIHHPTNLGYGAALANGFAAAECDLVFYTDSDLQFDVRELGGVIAQMLEAGADAVFGFRVYRYDSVLRCLLSWTYNRLVRVLFGVRVRDVDCAFKVFRRPVVQAMALESTDFFIDTEMVAQTARLGYRSIEVGVRHYPRLAGRTTVQASDIPRTLRTVARMWWRIRRLDRKGR
ncbi:glycosyltransferase family 2 protein [Engelhardtia mirabilis]|uniref:glycosyltransferase family 2 protein n=1 Tax=Engelhardtia mirabilis TaxID=2528011 RepID=UPI003AF3AE0E